MASLLMKAPLAKREKRASLRQKLLNPLRKSIDATEFERKLWRGGGSKIREKLNHCSGER